MNVNFIFSNDIGNNNINSGFFIVKNSKYSIDFLTIWAFDENLYKSNPTPGWWDQGVLIDMFNKNLMDVQNNSVIIDYGILQHFYENELTTLTNRPYVFHMAGRKNEIRFKTSKKYFDNLTCNNPNNIKKNPVNQKNKKNPVNQQNKKNPQKNTNKKNKNIKK